MKTTPNQSGQIYQKNQPNQPYRPDPVNQSPQPQVIHMAKWVLLPMRLFLGITFLYAGIQKLADPQFFNPAARGYIGKQIMAFATGSPLHDILIRLVVPHALLFGALVAYGEIAIGLGVLFGLLFRPAAFFGILINLVFFLSATWHVYPYFYGSDIVFIFCWLTLLISGPLNTGLPSLDEWLVQNVLSAEQRTNYAPALAFFLAINTSPTPLPSPASALTNQGRQAPGQQRSQTKYAQVQRAKQQSRRNFLWGMLTGGAGLAVLAWLGNNLHLFPGSETESSTSSTGSSTSSATATSTETPAASSTVITQANTIQNNSAATFTLASNGDPGILVRLNNGQFVAYDAVCTHAGCPVDYDPGSHLLVCPCHGAEFDPAKSAAVVQGPAATPLTNVPIHVDSRSGAITVSQ